MKNLKISVYQLDCANETSFEMTANVALNNIKVENVAEIVAARLFKVFNAQQAITEKCGKHRFFGLAKGKTVYLHLTVDSEILFETAMVPANFGLKVKIQDLTEDQFSFLISKIIEAYS